MTTEPIELTRLIDQRVTFKGRTYSVSGIYQVGQGSVTLKLRKVVQIKRGRP